MHGQTDRRASLKAPSAARRPHLTQWHGMTLSDDYAWLRAENWQKFKSLKRHLRTHYNLSPEEYREKWGLSHDYPMVAPNYARARSDLAKKMGLGTRREK